MQLTVNETNKEKPATSLEIFEAFDLMHKQGGTEGNLYEQKCKIDSQNSNSRQRSFRGTEE